MAYNAEKTLPRTAASIFAQSYGDWVWYLVDNGSTDSTGKIIHELAKRDHRIVPLANKKNQIWEPGNGITEVVEPYDDSDCICWIDADDTYKPDFLKKSLAAMSENALDIVACGNDFMDALTNKLVGTRVLNQNLIIAGEGFSQNFIQYHQFMRTYWAKLFSVAVLRRYDSTRVPTVFYGWDTLFTQEMFHNAFRIGILSESMYQYYISQKSASYQWNVKRIDADRILYKAARDFLFDKCGFVSTVNEEFLLLVYMNAIKDTLAVLLKSGKSDTEKLMGILDIFSHADTKRLAAWKNLGTIFGDVAGMTRQRTGLFAAAAKWLLLRKEVPDEQVERFCDVGQLVCAAAENADGWVFFKKLRAQFWIGNGRTDKARAEVDELAELLPADREIAGFQAQLNEPHPPRP
ncbi:MAG: glycosyltransferase family 2 protein [Oscillospiraceae bacterium]|jgi:glycosyltransferase involved in cell wall biosynthesis|nr:glycosyltransferase family 2 protein [Oscillospiraceae bacterium]MCI1990152.1 glycosyltransferase family 2 protein [Oscillospiraceae bacterium]MCI2034891.1 glycosyltransferase family 2 protein [Oscillospiraceae bacterium]